jgi:hypothetical protein
VQFLTEFIRKSNSTGLSDEGAKNQDWLHHSRTTVGAVELGQLSESLFRRAFPREEGTDCEERGQDRYNNK